MRDYSEGTFPNICNNTVIYVKRNPVFLPGTRDHHGTVQNYVTHTLASKKNTKLRKMKLVKTLPRLQSSEEANLIMSIIHEAESK